MKIENIFSTAFIIALFVQIIKGSGLLFRKHQIKYIQDRFEILVLKLEYFNTKEFCVKYLYTIKVLITSYILSTAVLGYYSIHYLNLNFNLFKIIIIALDGIFSFSLFWALIYFQTDRDNDSKSDRNWGLPLLFIEGILLILVSACIIFFTNHSSLINAMIRVDIIFACSYIITLLLFYLLLFFATTLLKVMRRIVWRIVEYNKGVVAAISLIITIILGIVALTMNLKTKES
jgi:hypothetical protein